MRKSSLTIILLIAAITAVWAQKPDKKTVKLENRLVGTFVEVPGANYTVSDANGDKTVSFAAFRMLQTEVSIESYKRFLDDLKAQGRMADYEKAKIDTARAMPELPTNYFSQPSYLYNPVACISYEGAILFCSWLTEKMGGEWEYTLPTKEQWKYAARSGKTLSFQYSMGFDEIFPDMNGNPMYTYLMVNDACITMRDGHLEIIDKPFGRFEEEGRALEYRLPTHIYSHHPNLLSLYNMCGNVAEMVAERGVAFGGSFLDPGYDIRIDSEKRYDAPSPRIGFRVIAVRKK